MNLKSIAWIETGNQFFQFALDTQADVSNQCVEDYAKLVGLDRLMTPIPER